MTPGACAPKLPRNWNPERDVGWAVLTSDGRPLKSVLGLFPFPSSDCGLQTANLLRVLRNRPPGLRLLFQLVAQASLSCDGGMTVGLQPGPAVRSKQLQQGLQIVGPCSLC